jgi:hypothetical protein
MMYVHDINIDYKKLSQREREKDLELQISS